ncbi:hypothetical protein OA93_20135 [Flavobacterium sp. KMS]|nr:hypothetical protein OA93_20135 [Flavobacterium sp. KMS]
MIGCFFHLERFTIKEFNRRVHKGLRKGRKAQSKKILLICGKILTAEFAKDYAKFLSALEP